LRVGQEAAEGLAAAHALGLIHRDIKPANLYLEAPRGRVKILDFGIARRTGEDPHKALTGTGIVVGTPGFMSPEQASGKPLDGRTDLFSLGVVLYHATTGRLPFDGETALAMLTALIVEEPPPVRTQNPDVSPDLEVIIHHLLAKKPDHRPASAAVVADELRALSEGREVPLATAEPEPLSAPARPTAPVVVTVYAPPAPNAFSGLISSATVEAVKRTERTPPRRSGRGVWIASGVAILLAVVVVVGVALAMRKPTAQKDIPAPEVKTPPTQKTSPKTTPSPTPIPTPAPGPDPYPGPSNPLPPGPVPVNADFEAALKKFLANNATENDLQVLRTAHGRLSLRLGMTALDDAGFETLSNFPWVEEMPEFQISIPKLTDKGLASIARFKSVQLLSLINTQVTDEGLKRLAELPELKHLALYGARLTDKAAPQLAKLRNIVSLELGNTAFGDDGLKGLEPLTSLVQLGLRETQVTDAGLKHLHGRNLVWVDVRNTKVSAAAVKQLSDTLRPGAQVVSDQSK
jgi:hypothetical protein